MIDREWVVGLGCLAVGTVGILLVKVSRPHETTVEGEASGSR